MTDVKTSANQLVSIRKAGLKDTDILVKIHRESFPFAVSYQIPDLYHKKWWQFVVTCPYAEVYVISLGGQVSGAATMVIEETLYAKEKKLHYPPLSIRLLTILSSPDLMLSLFKTNIEKFSYGIGKRHVLKSADCSNPSGRIWIEPIVIAQQCRRQNLAKNLLSFMERRAAELKTHSIHISVDKVNYNAVSFYESQNFKLYNMNASLLYYKKEINIP